MAKSPSRRFALGEALGDEATRLIIGRFEAERQALSMMKHPNIAEIFGGGVTPLHGPYIVMEYCSAAPSKSTAKSSNSICRTG